MPEANKKRVGVIRGGAHGGYHSSLRQGGEIIMHIADKLPERWKVADILIDKEGVWHINGLRTEPASIIHKVDVVWNTAHPGISNVLADLSLPHIAVSPFSFLLGQESGVLTEHLKGISLNTPKKIVLPVYQSNFDGPLEEYAARKAKEIWRKFPAPWIVKTYTEDSDMGVHVAKTFPQLVDAILDGVAHQKSILVEELVGGVNASVHSVAGWRGQDIYIFPVRNIENGYKEKLESIVKNLHRHLGATHYLRSDFAIHPRRGIFVTEISFLPDLKEDSHFHRACASVGAEMHHVVEHILNRALS